MIAKSKILAKNLVKKLGIVLAPVDNILLGGGVLPYMGYIGRCRCEGYGFQAVYSTHRVYKSEHMGLE